MPHMVRWKPGELLLVGMRATWTRKDSGKEVEAKVHHVKSPPDWVGEHKLYLTLAPGSDADWAVMEWLQDKEEKKDAGSDDYRWPIIVHMPSDKYVIFANCHPSAYEQEPGKHKVIEFTAQHAMTISRDNTRIACLDAAQEIAESSDIVTQNQDETIEHIADIIYKHIKKVEL